MELSALARASDEKWILKNVAFPLCHDVCDTTMSQSRDMAMSQSSAIAFHPAPIISPQQATETRFRV